MLGIAAASPHYASADARNILANGNFEEWGEHSPAEWTWVNNPPAIRQLSETRMGNPVVSIRDANLMFQDYENEALRKGDRVVFEGFFRTGEQNTAHPELRVWYRDPGAERAEVRAHRHETIPTGGWQYLRLSVTVPEDNPSFVRFAVRMRDEIQSPVLVSGLRAYIVPGMP